MKLWFTMEDTLCKCIIVIVASAPAEQLLHDGKKPRVGWAVPGGHARHAAASEAPVLGLYVPAGHARHFSAWPFIGLNVPTGQSTHSLSLER